MFGQGRGETNGFLDTANPIKDDGPTATLHIIDGQLEERHTDRRGDGQPRDEVQDSRHCRLQSLSRKSVIGWGLVGGDWGGD